MIELRCSRALYALVFVAGSCFADPTDPASIPVLISFRFEPVGGCNVVLDQHTRLMWQRCSFGQTWSGGTCVGRPARIEWNSAIRIRDDHCGFADWHLPSLRDLEQLVIESGIPAIDSAAFPGTPPASYWTASVSTASPHQAWYVNFGKGSAHHIFKDSNFHVRLVREAK